MRIGSSLRNRHFIVRLERGEELIDSLKALISRERSKVCSFTGHGFFSKCQIQNYFPDKHAIENQFSCENFVCVPFLSGNITTLGKELIVTTFGVVSFDICGQINTLTGIISNAKVFDLELHITVFDDLSVVRSMDAVTGLLPISRISNEDYADNIKNSSSFGGTDELPLGNNGDSDVPSISGFSNITQNPIPEVIHRGMVTGYGHLEEKKPATEASDSQVEIKKIEAASTNIKRRRRVSVIQENDALDDVKPNNEEDKNAPARRRVNAIQISSDEKSPVLDNKDPVSNEHPIADNPVVVKPSKTEDEIKDYRRRTHTFHELSGVKEDVEISVGNWVIHPSLGKCKVIALLKNNCIQIKTEGGSAKDISLSYFKLVKTEDIEDRTCFQLDRI